MSAGSSVSARDLTAQVIESLGEPGVLVHGVSLRPGKPTILAVCGDKAAFGLPGNPVAAMVTFMRIARPLILTLSGRTVVDPHTFKVPAAFDMKKKVGRREWLRASLEIAEDGQLHATKYPQQGSGVLDRKSSRLNSSH